MIKIKVINKNNNNSIDHQAWRGASWGRGHFLQRSSSESWILWRCQQLLRSDQRHLAGCSCNLRGFSTGLPCDFFCFLCYVLNLSKLAKFVLCHCCSAFSNIFNLHKSCKADGASAANLEGHMLQHHPEIHVKISDWFRLESLMTRVSLQTRRLVADHARRCGFIWPLNWFRNTSCLLPPSVRAGSSSKFATPNAQLSPT